MGGDPSASTTCGTARRGRGCAWRAPCVCMGGAWSHCAYLSVICSGGGCVKRLQQLLRRHPLLYSLQCDFTPAPLRAPQAQACGTARQARESRDPTLHSVMPRTQAAVHEHKLETQQCTSKVMHNWPPSTASALACSARPLLDAHPGVARRVHDARVVADGRAALALRRQEAEGLQHARDGQAPLHLRKLVASAAPAGAPHHVAAAPLLSVHHLHAKLPWQSRVLWA